MFDAFEQDQIQKQFTSMMRLMPSDSDSALTVGEIAKRALFDLCDVCRDPDMDATADDLANAQRAREFVEALDANAITVQDVKRVQKMAGNKRDDFSDWFGWAWEDSV